MQELYLGAGSRLVSEAEWNKRIGKLPRHADFYHRPSARKELQDALLNALRIRLPKKFGLLFSGGIDSIFLAALCKKLRKNFACIAVGAKGSSDLRAAKEAAKMMKLKLASKLVKPAELDSYFQKAALLIPQANALQISIAAVIYSAILVARSRGIKVLVSGLGAEEIFGGYARHEAAADVNRECLRGLREVFYRRDLARDVSLSKKLKMKVITPFIDKNVISVAMAMPGEWKISGGHRKLVLREAARDSGIPDKLCWRKKVAAQYGSNFDNAMERISISHGFWHKHEYANALVNPGKVKTYKLAGGRLTVLNSSKEKSHGWLYLDRNASEAHAYPVAEEIKQLQGSSLIQYTGTERKIPLRPKQSMVIAAGKDHIHSSRGASVTAWRIAAQIKPRKKAAGKWKMPKPFI